jgi:hypothetical protein
MKILDLSEAQIEVIVAGRADTAFVMTSSAVC